MKTRSQRLARERAGHPPSPPQRLPSPQRRPRAPKKVIPAVELNSTVNLKDSNSEASVSPLLNVHPVLVRSYPSTQVSSVAEEDLKNPGGVPNTPGSPTSNPSGVPNTFGSPTPITGGVPNTPNFPTSSFGGVPNTRDSPALNTPAPSVATSPVVKFARPDEQQVVGFFYIMPSPEEAASLLACVPPRPPPVDPTTVLAIPFCDMSDLIDLLDEKRKQREHDLLTNSAESAQISPSSGNMEEMTQSAQPVPTEPAAHEMSQPAEPDEIEWEIDQPTPTYSTRPKPKDWRRLPMQILAAASLPRAPAPHPDQVYPFTIFKRVDRYDINGNLQFGLEEELITAPSEVPESETLGSNSLSQPAESTETAQKPLSARHKGAASVEDGSDSDSASESGSIQSDYGSTYDSMDQSSDEATMQMLQEPTPATPIRTGWGLGSLMKSARSVTKYLPGFSHLSPVPENSSPVTSSARKNKRRRSKNLSRAKNFRSKETVRTSRTKQSKRASARAEAEALKEEELRKAKEAEALEEARRKDEMATTPGKKRKRLASPDFIPNPPGCSYGMDLTYFQYYSSSDEGDSVNTPSKKPSKIRRTSGSEELSGQGIGDPKKAQPYVGVYFGEESSGYHGGNVFSEARATDEAKRRAQEAPKNVPQIPKNKYFAKQERERKEKGVWPAPPPTPRSWDVPPLTPIAPNTNPTGTFKVPSPPSESDSEMSGADVSLQASSKPRKRASRSIKEGGITGHAAHPSVAQLATPAAMKASAPIRKTPSTCPQASHVALASAVGSSQSGGLPGPSQTPQSLVGASTPGGLPGPSQATQSLVGASTESEALRKARNKALQHKPRTPSTLSQSSRINTGPIGFLVEGGNQSTIQNSSLVQPSSVNIAATTSHPHAPSVSFASTTTFNATEDYLKTVDPTVAAFLAGTTMDSADVGRAFTEAVTIHSAEETGAEQEVAVPNTQAALHNIHSSVPNIPTSTDPTDSILRLFAPLRELGISEEVEAHLNANWDARDQSRSAYTFSKNYSRYLEAEEAENAKTVAPTAIMTA